MIQFLIENAFDVLLAIACVGVLAVVGYGWWLEEQGHHKK